MSSMPKPPEPIKVFYAYSHVDKDEKMLEDLEKQLHGAVQDGFITTWSDRKILPGMDSQQAINEQLRIAKIILVLVSPDFVVSKEYKRLVDIVLKKKDVVVIPIKLRPISIEGTELGKLQTLPRNDKAISQWEDSDDALCKVAEDIRKVAEGLVANEWFQVGLVHFKAKHYIPAIEAYQKALQADPTFTDAYNATGDAFYALGRSSDDLASYLDKALASYQQAVKIYSDSVSAWYGIGNVYRDQGIKRDQSDKQKEEDYRNALNAYGNVTRLEPKNAWAWYEQGKILQRLRRFEEALVAYDHAIKADNKIALFHHDKGYVFEELNKPDKALEEAEKAILLDPKYVSTWRNKGEALRKLGRYSEALKAYEEAIRLNPKYPNGYNGRGWILLQFGKCQEALADFERAIELKKDYKWAWVHKGEALKCLAQQAREEAERLDDLAKGAYEKARELGYNR